MILEKYLDILLVHLKSEYCNNVHVNMLILQNHTKSYFFFLSQTRISK